MGLGQIFAVLGRRWYLLVLGVLLSLGLGYGALLLTPPVYQAKGSVLLLPSQEQLDAGGRNPFLHLDALTSPAAIVIAKLSGTQAQDEIEAISPKAEFVVEPDPAMRGPGILATVTDVTPDAALSTLDVLLKKIGDTLTAVQNERNVPRTAVVSSMTLVVDSKAEPDTSATVRMVVAAVAAGLAVTAILIFSLDGLLLRRRLRKSAEAPDAGATPADEGDADQPELDFDAESTPDAQSDDVASALDPAGDTGPGASLEDGSDTTLASESASETGSEALSGAGSESGSEALFDSTAKPARGKAPGRAVVHDDGAGSDDPGTSAMAGHVHRRAR